MSKKLTRRNARRIARPPPVTRIDALMEAAYERRALAARRFDQGVAQMDRKLRHLRFFGGHGEARFRRDRFEADVAHNELLEEFLPVHDAWEFVEEAKATKFGFRLNEWLALPPNMKKDVEHSHGYFTPVDIDPIADAFVDKRIKLHRQAGDDLLDASGGEFGFSERDF